jgi:hypothetical protein
MSDLGNLRGNKGFGLVCGRNNLSRSLGLACLLIIIFSSPAQDQLVDCT